MRADDHKINSTCDTNTDEMMQENNLQKPNIYNKYLPFYDSIKRQGVSKFDEIRENLSRSIQLNELQPGFSFWSNALQEFITLYGFYFTKTNHLKLVNFYLSVLSITDLQYTSVHICCELLSELLRKTRLITRDDLVIDWHTLYRWAKLIHSNHDKAHALVTLPEFVLHIVDERKAHPLWWFQPRGSYRLTEQNITDFVNCIKDYVFISIFNKEHGQKAIEACKYLSMLRPELIVPPVIEKLFSSIENITEPHRFTAIVDCLTYLARQLVRQTSSYSEGQAYVLPLLMSVLPGIDLNDPKKIYTTLKFLNTVLSLITCVDCSSAVQIRDDLTEIEKQVCLSTKLFENFISTFLDRVFQMIEHLSSDMFDTTVITDEVNIDYRDIELLLESILRNITGQCSSKIYWFVQEKLTNFLSGAYFSPKVKGFVSAVVRALLHGNPVEALKCVLPKTCESIEKIMNHADTTELFINGKEDLELIWYLTLFSELVRARGDTLLIYKPMIMSIFNRSIHIVHKYSYEILANAARDLLESLSYVYPIEYRLTIENLDEPFIDFLPIRVWGQPVDFDRFQMQYHIPNVDEIDFACEFVKAFLYSELTLLNEKILKLSNQERSRSLSFVYNIALGYFHMIPRIESEQLADLVLSVVPYNSKYQFQTSTYMRESKFNENLRMRLVNDIGKLLDLLVKNHLDDVASMKKALEILSLSSIYYGVSKKDNAVRYRYFNSNKKIFKNQMCDERRALRFLTIETMALQIEDFILSNCEPMTHIDEQVVFRLFELSLHQYIEIRRIAQSELFSVLNHYAFSSNMIADRIVEVLKTANETDHDQVKGCLYILLGNDSFFLPTKISWSKMEKLWPSIASVNHSEKRSITNLIQRISHKIEKLFVTKEINQNANEESTRAAITLWCAIESKELETGNKLHEQQNLANTQSYNNLMEQLNSLITSNTTWKQQQVAMSMMFHLFQKYIPMSCSCIRTCVDLLVHDNVELREYAIKSIAAICRLQKPPRIYVEKPLGEILQHNGQSSVTIINDAYHPGDRMDNAWLTIDGYIPPTTQSEWEQTCFLDKSFHGYYTWPKMIKYSINKRERYSQNNMPEQAAILYNRFIDKNFVKRMTQFMILDHDNVDGQTEFDTIRFAAFKGLFRNFGLAFIDNFMEQLYMLIHEKTKEKQNGSHRVAAEIVAGIIRGSKYWTIEMLDELWKNLTVFLNEVCSNLNSNTCSCWGSCFKYAMENVDPRRMYRPIQFLQSLINNPAVINISSVTSLWYIIQQLDVFKWRVPSIWCYINDHVKKLLHHSFTAIRDRMAIVLSISLIFDLTLFHGESIRQPNIDQTIDEIHEQLHRAIKSYEEKPLTNVSDQIVEIDPEVREALNFIDTVILIHTKIFFFCSQPIKNSIIRIFPTLCNIESIVAHDDVVKTNLAISRLNVGMAYLNVNFVEALIKQLEHVYERSTWHARQVAIDFVQTMIFSNLFNARSYANRIHDFVLKSLSDEQYEVRIIASTTLSGLYQCGYIQVTDEDLKYFRIMSKTNYFTKINTKKVISTNDIIKRHAGVLGLCAIVLSNPYDIPMYVPDVLMLLCEHPHDPHLIQKSIKQCLSDFRHTHHDSWHEHREKFTDDQLVILTDVLISHTYYA
ncbi:unnamed protein product [Rotaria magnacalcarata]|uniref:Proteasome activator complex subunit 4 n=1 Tax=Rotaria magnacalcarata TaxID=392030 RepID=A0A816W9N8_9BILA|nr:unnamed protein product [Rotaria magnacalcarata]